MARFDESIEVNATVSEAYRLFSQFERFPGFMEGVQEVRRTGTDTLFWKAEIGGREEEWEAKVTKEEPDTAIAWQSVSGARNAGEVTFDKVDQNTTQVNLHIEYEPEGFVENVGAMLGVVNGRMKGDLQRFKEMVESGGNEAGWHDPADRSTAATDRQRAVGEAERSQHRDDVGYERREHSGLGSRDAADRSGIADSSGIAGAAGVAGSAGAAGTTGTSGAGTDRGLGSVGGAVDRGLDSAGGAVNRGLDSAGGAVDRGLDSAGGAIDRGMDTAGNAADRGLDRAGNAMDRAGSSFDRNVDRAGNAIDSGMDDAGNMAQDGVNRAGDAANRTSDRVSDMANRGAEKAQDWADRGADDDRTEADPLDRNRRNRNDA